jgi:hypothetical protein
MGDFAQALGFVVAALNALAGLYGAWRWWRVDPDRAFWVLLRLAQAATAVYAIAAGVLYLTGERPADGLYWLYVLLPIPVSFVAEQLRAVSAQTVLDARGLDDAQAVGALPDAEQRSIVRAILRRETGVMALACLVVCFLILRALGTA